MTIAAIIERERREIRERAAELALLGSEEAIVASLEREWARGRTGHWNGSPRAVETYHRAVIALRIAELKKGMTC